MYRLVFDLLFYALVITYIVYVIKENKSRKAYVEAVADATQQNERILLALAQYHKVTKELANRKQMEIWNIRLLRQEIINLVKAKGGKL